MSVDGTGFEPGGFESVDSAPEGLESVDSAPEGFDPIAYINEPRWRTSSLGLERITCLMKLLENPQNDFRSIHVAGTNGKGSVCAYLSSILRQHGLKVGLFTSPYIHEFEERIRINGENIAYSDLLAITLKVKDAAEKTEEKIGSHPTEFELMCAVAFMYFAKEKCDVAVLETGLGGRLDSTNIVNPELCIITSIGLDHTEILGDTLEKIASEKAGIIKRGVPVVSYPQPFEAMDVIKERCVELGCPLKVVDFCTLHVLGIDSAQGTRHFEYDGHSYTTKLIGSYQPENAACAIEAAQMLSRSGIELSHEEIKKGIACALWPGRFDVVCTHPTVIIDGSHNPQGALALRSSLEHYLEAVHSVHKKVLFVIGVLGDKDYKNILAPMLPFAKKVFTYTPDNPRALSSADLAHVVFGQAEAHQLEIGVTSLDTADQAIKAAMQCACHDDVIVCFGTLYAIDTLEKAVLSCKSEM